MSVKFEDLDFLVLTADHLHLLPTFKCNNTELKGFLIEDAYQKQIDRISVTRLVLYQGRLVGYFTLVTDVIKKGELVDGDGDPDFKYGTYPALKIARLATHQEFERQGIGRYALLKIFALWIRLSAHIGCRIITVDAKPTAVGFYKKFGFQEAIMDPKKLTMRETIPLYIDIHKELERVRKNSVLSDFGEKRH
ncbi:GNAT family N-acetyltransferase [Methanoregula sp.]|jgi:GNAT superfamily N-acetyltransferase|uniref:GNAT family N-acetyltransferase n=1 Tax=Methanoregula sp. TaxID=2052170 RepID=UPI003567D093